MTQRPMTILLAVALAGAAAVAQSACSSRSTSEQCYEVWEGGPTPRYPRGVCGWEDLPTGPEGSNFYWARVCVPVDAAGGCDSCDVDAIDEMLREQIAKECCKPVDTFMRGCQWLHEREPEPDECCYFAGYYSTCTEPSLGSEPNCESEGS